MSDRPKFSRVYIGAPGSGKSSLQLKLLENYHKKAIIISPDDNDKIWHKYPPIKLEDVGRLTKGIRRIRYDWEEPDGFILELFNRFRGDAETGKTGGLFLFDDTKMYLNSIEKVKAIEKELGRHRHTDMDLIFTFHGFSRVNSLLWTYIKEIVLFRTTDSVEGGMGIPQYKKMRERKEYIDAQAKTNPHFYKTYSLV